MHTQTSKWPSKPDICMLHFKTTTKIPTKRAGKNILKMLQTIHYPLILEHCFGQRTENKMQAKPNQDQPNQRNRRSRGEP